MLSASAVTYWGAAFSGIFDISAQGVSEGVSSDDDDGWCFIDGLNAKWKIIMDLICPILICVFMSSIFVISRLCGKKMHIGAQKVNFQTAFLAVFLFIVGKVVNTLFEMMASQSVGSETVHFYFAYEACYGGTWFLAIGLLLLIIVSFGVPFGLARKMTGHALSRCN